MRRRIPAFYLGIFQSAFSSSSPCRRFVFQGDAKLFVLLNDMILQSDLDLSVENGLWATQKHNETILDQAYRTSTEVILIFGVNKSGEFYGYARYVMLSH